MFYHKLSNHVPIDIAASKKMKMNVLYFTDMLPFVSNWE